MRVRALAVLPLALCLIVMHGCASSSRHERTTTASSEGSSSSSVSTDGRDGSNDEMCRQLLASGQAARRDGDNAAAVQAFTDLEQRCADAPIAVQAEIDHIEALLALGDEATAITRSCMFVQRHPTRPEVRRAQEFLEQRCRDGVARACASVHALSTRDRCPQ